MKKKLKRVGLPFVVFQMKQYKVILNFTFEPHCCDVEDEYDSDGEMIEKKGEKKEQYEAFQRTDAYFQEHDIEEYIKENDAFPFVEYLPCDGEVVSAKWVPDKFAIEMVVDTEQTAEELEEDLRGNSLEDGEYEACGDTGWIVMTRGPKNERFGPPWDMKNFWEYGLTDYRSNPMTIEELGAKEEIPSEKDLLTMTEKGKEVYQKMAADKLQGIRFNEEDERKFQVMKILMNDKRMYPVGKA